MKYQLKYWFEHGGGCLWASNEVAKEKYGYLVNHQKLPLSAETIAILCQLEDEYSTYLNWDDPASPSLWTNEHKTDFVARAQRVYEAIRVELGADYIVASEINSCFI